MFAGSSFGVALIGDYYIYINIYISIYRKSLWLARIIPSQKQHTQNKKKAFSFSNLYFIDTI